MQGFALLRRMLPKQKAGYSRHAFIFGREITIMAKKERIYMPLGTGGLIRYREEEESKVKIKPEQLVVISIILIFLEVFLKMVGW